jgi:uncharacterized protein YkwD/uncharacterized membrane protein required for colicin V production
MTWVDLLIPLVVAAYIYRGVRRGFIISAMELAAFGVSLLIAIGLCRPVGRLLQGLLGAAEGPSSAIALLLVWGVSQAALLLAASRLGKRLPAGLLESRWNAAAGSLPAAIEAVILIALVLTLLVVLPLPAVPKSAIISSALGRPLVEGTYRFETALAERLGGPVGVGLGFVTVEPESTQRLALRLDPSRLRTDASEEREMFRRVNAERAQRGLPPLEFDAGLTRLARAYARRMFSGGFFGHVAPDGSAPAERMIRAGIPFVVMGENLALAGTVSIAHRGLMQSPGHRANILSSDFRRVGIGAVDSGVLGTMFVQEFAG